MATTRLSYTYERFKLENFKNFFTKIIQNSILSTSTLLINLYRIHTFKDIIKEVLLAKSKSATSGPNFEISYIQKK